MADYTNLVVLILFLVSVTSSNNQENPNPKLCACTMVDIEKPDVGLFKNCKVNKNGCMVTCKLECPKVKFSWSKTHDFRRRTYAKASLKCVDAKWIRTDNGPRSFCKAEIVNNEVEQNFPNVAIEQLNELVRQLLHTSYFYLGMVSFYKRPDVALPGFMSMMTGLWQADQKFAVNVINYIIKRGGYVTLYDIPRPSSNEMLLQNQTTRAGMDGVGMAIKANRKILDHVLDLVEVAKAKRDPHLKHFLEDGLMEDKIAVIKTLADVERRLAAFSDDDYSVGEYAEDTEQLA